MSKAVDVLWDERAYLFQEKENLELRLKELKAEIAKYNRAIAAAEKIRT